VGSDAVVVVKLSRDGYVVQVLTGSGPKALIREVKEETGLTVTGIPDQLGSFDYWSGTGKRSRQFNFVVDVAAPEPVKLTGHDACVWTPVTDDLPVTDAVKAVLWKCREPGIV
jgi:8-oxo-dGTP diphosphatase